MRGSLPMKESSECRNSLVRYVSPIAKCYRAFSFSGNLGNPVPVGCMYYQTRFLIRYTKQGSRNVSEMQNRISVRDNKKVH